LAIRARSCWMSQPTISTSNPCTGCRTICWSTRAA
jgi:hypothetical protein